MLSKGGRDEDCVGPRATKRGNFGKYSNPSYDALMKQVRESTDLEQVIVHS